MNELLGLLMEQLESMKGGAALAGAEVPPNPKPQTLYPWTLYPKP